MKIFIESYVEKIQRIFKSLSSYYFILGVIDETSNRKDLNWKNREGEINNAEILLVHEYGSPLRKIPKRSILSKTIESEECQRLIEDGIHECINLILDDWDNWKKVKQVLEKTAIRIQSLVYENISQGKLDLSPLKSRKGLPLFDTGQLAKSIVCRVMRNKN